MLCLLYSTDVEVVNSGSDALVLRKGRRTIDLSNLPPCVSQLIHQLKERPHTESSLLDLVVNSDGETYVAELYYGLELLLNSGCLVYCVIHDAEPLVTVEPLSPSFRCTGGDFCTGTAFKLSSFAYCRSRDGRFILECPLGFARIIIHDPRIASAVWSLSQLSGATPDQLTELGIPKEILIAFFSILIDARAIAPLNAFDDPTHNDGLSKQWDFHDLVFHSRSRLGRHDYPFGATFPYRNMTEPAPARRRASETSARIELAVPQVDRGALFEDDFLSVLDRRSSVKFYATVITLAEVSDFLFFSARVKEERLAIVGVPTSYDSTRRPHPSGGACHPLELYLAVNKCEGLREGLYRYDAFDHCLEHLPDKSVEVNALLSDAQRSCGQVPQILLLLTARFQRVNWKYQSIAYATILKDVGVMFQTMYLVATHLGLSPCALGGGNSELFAAATSLPYLEESTVGEFMLGGRPCESSGQVTDSDRQR